MRNCDSLLYDLQSVLKAKCINRHGIDLRCSICKANLAMTMGANLKNRHCEANLRFAEAIYESIEISFCHESLK